MSAIPAVGKTVGGKYRLVRVLGEGGMGVVFEAEHLVTAKRVALKWLQGAPAKHREGATRLVREAQAAARVRHPNVVDVYDVDSDGEAVFLVMELLEGEPLSKLLDRGLLPIHQVIALLIPAMRGVAAAHRQGVIHRDLKPDNIFLARVDDDLAPVPKVLDFGISKLDARGVEQATLTRTGSAIGTPLYMSREQLAGAKDIDVRTDVYAFGVILYEALTGVPPFVAESFWELAVRVATASPPPPRAHRLAIPAELEAIVLRAIAGNRDDRTPSVEVLIRELAPFAVEDAYREPPARQATAPAPPGGVAPWSESITVAGDARRASEGEPPRPPVSEPRRALPQQRAVQRGRRSLGALVLIVPLVFAGARYAWRGEPAPPAVVHPDGVRSPPALEASRVRTAATPLPVSSPPEPPTPSLGGAIAGAAQAEAPGGRLGQARTAGARTGPERPVRASRREVASAPSDSATAVGAARLSTAANVDSVPAPPRAAVVPDAAPAPAEPAEQYRVNKRPREDEF